MSDETRVDREALDDIDQGLLACLTEAANKWGALGVLRVAAAMWPDAAVLALIPAPHPQGGTEDDPAAQIEALIQEHGFSTDGGWVLPAEDVRNLLAAARYTRALLAAAPAPTEGKR